MSLRIYDENGRPVESTSSFGDTFPVNFKDSGGNVRITFDTAGIKLFDSFSNQVLQLSYGGGISLVASAMPDVPVFDLGPSGMTLGSFFVDNTGLVATIGGDPIATEGYVTAHSGAADFGNFSIDDVTPTPYGFSIDEAFVVSNTVSDGKMYLGVTGVVVFEGHEVFFGFSSRSGGSSESMGMYVNARSLYFWDSLVGESAFFIKGDTGQTIVCGPGQGYSPSYDDGTGAILQVNGDVSAVGSYWAGGTQGGSGFSVLDADGVTTHAVVGGLVML